MLLKSIPVGMMQTNCYILADEETGECAVFDPGSSLEKILDGLREDDLKVSYIVLTHGHFDHVMASGQLQQAVGGELMIHENEKDWLTPEHVGHRGYVAGGYVEPEIGRLLTEGSTFQIGSIPCRVLHTPGHTPGSCCIICGEELMIAGDTLFLENCGRWDLEGGCEEDLMRSLKKLHDIEGDYKVYPGHGEPTTLGWEREHNPWMRESLSR